MNDSDILNNATRLHKQEQNITNENMDTLEAHELGSSVLTLQEALGLLETE
jgi:hypothetical protein